MANTNNSFFTRTIMNEQAYQQQAMQNLRRKAQGRNMMREALTGDANRSSYDSKVAFLSVFILLFLYGSDDGVISDKEKKGFSKLLKANKGMLSPSDYSELLSKSEIVLKTDYVIDYIREKGFSVDLVNKAAELIRKLALKDYNYIKTLNELLEINRNR